LSALERAQAEEETKLPAADAAPVTARSSNLPRMICGAFGKSH
jgi:hypothetical protein